MAQLVKSLPAMQETWVQCLGWEDPLEKEMAPHSSILAWRIRTGTLMCCSYGVKRVWHNLATEQQQQWPYLTWLYLQKPYFQIRSHSQILGVQTSIYLFGGNTVHWQQTLTSWRLKMVGEAGGEWQMQMLWSTGASESRENVTQPHGRECWVGVWKAMTSKLRLEEWEVINQGLKLG